ncbi:MAG TPA: peptidylprolyl isomerase [Adhaeribacter sp.]|nr:peptidylprolyl isomerase [Adhaeribacter sp.]
MNRIVLWLWFFLLAGSACQKKRTPEEQIKLRQELEQEVPKDRVREFLTEYGRQNPETEVLISTSLGKIKVKLYEDTPLHRANFIRLAKEGYYDNTVFYRILKSFMIQGGNPGDYVNRADHYTVPQEIKRHHFHKKGALAMARFDDDINPERASSSHNFYLVQGAKVGLEELEDIARQKKLTLTPEQKELYPKIGGAPTLDEQYTVFGEVVEGMDVLDKIARVPVTADDRPTKPIYVTMKVLR